MYDIGMIPWQDRPRGLPLGRPRGLCGLFAWQCSFASLHNSTLVTCKPVVSLICFLPTNDHTNRLPLLGHIIMSTSFHLQFWIALPRVMSMRQQEPKGKNENGKDNRRKIAFTWKEAGKGMEMKRKKGTLQWTAEKQIKNRNKRRGGKRFGKVLQNKMVMGNDIRNRRAASCKGTDETKWDMRRERNEELQFHVKWFHDLSSLLTKLCHFAPPPQREGAKWQSFVKAMWNDFMFDSAFVPRTEAGVRVPAQMALDCHAIEGRQSWAKRLNCFRDWHFLDTVYVIYGRFFRKAKTCKCLKMLESCQGRRSELD